MRHARRSLTSSGRRVPEREQTRYLSSKEAAEPLKHVSRFLKGLALTRHDRTHQGPRVALAGPRRRRHCSASAFTAAHSRRSPGCGNSQPLQPQLVARARSCRQSSSAPRRTLRSPSLTMLSGRPTKQRYGDRPQPAAASSMPRPIHSIVSHREGRTNEGSNACVLPHSRQRTRGIRISRSRSSRRWRWDPYQHCIVPAHPGQAGRGASICWPHST